jgi:UDPglucose 6-dehydrogenase
MVYLSRHYGLEEVALNEWQQHRIARLVVKSLYGTVTGKRNAVLGWLNATRRG